jgi:hypothetical protein
MVVQATKVVFQNKCTYLVTLPSTCFLIEAEVNSSVNPRVVNIVGDVFQIGIVENKSGIPG